MNVNAAPDLAAAPTLAERLKRTAFYSSVSEALAPEATVMVCGADGGVKARIAAAVSGGLPAVIIAPEAKDLRRWETDLSFFAPDVEILPFPFVEEADFAVAFTGTEALRARFRALSAVRRGLPCFVLATAVEAAAFLPAPETLEKESRVFSVGDVISRDELLAFFTSAGYERVDRVERCGHFAVRGDIVDIFGMGAAHPVRMEFFDDEIDGIRSFDEDTQRSLETLLSVTLLPTRAPAGKALLPAYAEVGLVIFDEPQRGEEALRRFLKEEKENKGKAAPWKDVAGAARGRTLLFSLLNRSQPDFSPRALFQWKGQAAMNFQRQLPLFASELLPRLAEGWTAVALAAKESEKKELENTLAENGIPLSAVPAPGKLCVADGVLSRGFESAEEKLAVYASGDLLGQPKLRRHPAAGKGKQLRFFSELTEGDYVVQETHGIGRYVGMRTMEIEGKHRDYITLQYAGGDTLYLPMAQISTLEKYIGPEGESPALSKMGGVQWEKVRSRAKAAIKELAERLLEVYAKRELTTGIAFAADTREQREFEEDFPYIETDDQLAAIEAIKRGMEKPEPMDMLLCGDVGFGKTEVAMRAVFKCVMSGYQSLVLVPTTVLSQQHFRTFSERMEKYGVRVALLNRFTTLKEKREILAGVAAGTVDVLIGTHAILGKRLSAKRLGLLVVDEEQRFGVVQKEKWKSREERIDILTLSATPIPRTLHMSLTGVRDMVTITEPPSNRHAIQTYVTEYDDAIAAEAIRREKARGGQVYFLFNRIASIDAMAQHLRNLLPPDITIGVAHGQMQGNQLEEIMYDFFQGKYDVLLCTTLIENGVDQPNANTLLVYDADHMGLSQLYQMRGRVGRSDKIARAYFFYRRGKILTEVAEKRLETIREFTELGAGFKIAMRDLEIRGAGNLLGAAQHGNIAAVGFATYCTMLDEAIRALRAERENLPRPKKLPDTVIEFSGDAYIDDKYIAKPDFKIEIYRRLANLSSEKEWADLLDEAIDRFGTPTPPVEKLFAAARLRVLARTLGIGSIAGDGDSLVLTWADTEPMRAWDFTKLPREYMQKLRFLPQSPVRVKIKKAVIPGDRTEWVTGLLEEIHREIRNSESGLRN